MAANLLQIVSDIASSPTVILDLNNENPFGAAEIDVSPPQLRYSSSSSMLADGARVSQSSYANRELHLTFDAISTSQDNWAASFQTLARAIDQDRFWIKYQPTGMTNPVFFYCFRASPEQISDIAGATAYRQVDLTVMADPAAYGLPETGNVTINNDPAAGTNPCFWRIGTSVKGDLETPLFLTAGAQTDLGGRTVFMVSQALGYSQSQTTPLVIQSGSLTTATSGVGTWATSSGDAAMSGGNYARYTSAVGLGTPTLTATGLLTSSLVGDYHLMARVRAGDTTTSWVVQAGVLDGSNGRHDSDAVSYDRANTGPHWLDLGVFRFPFAAPQTDLSFGTSAPTSGVNFIVRITSPNIASKTLDFDCFMLVPAGVDYATATRASMTGFPLDQIGSASNKAVFDSVADQAYTLNGSDQYAGTGSVSPIGVFPTVVPGADNSLHYLRHIGTGYNAAATILGGGTGTNDSLTASTTLTWKYWPRYLYLRPATT